jgi:hypothetical protein
MVIRGVHLAHILVGPHPKKGLELVEPTTTAIVTALSTGAAFVAKEAATQAVKDAYNRLKRWLESHYKDVSFEQLEAQPTSNARQEVVGRDLEREGASEDTELVNRARTVVQLVQEQALDVARSIGVDLGELHQANVTFGSVLAGKGATGVKVDEVTGGSVSFGDITAGLDMDSSKKA